MGDNFVEAIKTDEEEDELHVHVHVYPLPHALITAEVHSFLKWECINTITLKIKYNFYYHDFKDLLIFAVDFVVVVTCISQNF